MNLRHPRFLVPLAARLAVLGLLGVASIAAAPAGNLIPNAELRAGPGGKPAGWTTWAPRAELAPTAQVVACEGGTALELRATRFESYGQWVTRVEGIEPGKYYRFEAWHQSSGVESDDVSVLALLTWLRGPGDGGEIQRDYAEDRREEGGWRRSSRVIQAPPQARTVMIQLGLRWAARGAVLWKDIQLTEVAAPAARKVRLATTYLKPGAKPTIESNTRLMAEVFEAAGQEHPDLVLFSENFVDRGVRAPLAEKAQTIPGPLTRMLAEKAKAYRTHVVTTLHERDGDLYYNTAVLIDRDGRIAGRYRKVHLALAEADAGLTPGSDYPVFDTDFGRIGILTCWDNWFSEPARLMRLQGAAIVLWPLAGDGVPAHANAILRARAMDNGVYLVSSATVMDHQSVIINPAGEVLAEASAAGRYALAEIDLNQEWRVRYLSVASGLGEARSLYLKERRPDTYSQLRGEEPGARPARVPLRDE